jgi:hypothetical protein
MIFRAAVKFFPFAKRAIKPSLKSLKIVGNWTMLSALECKELRISNPTFVEPHAAYRNNSEQEYFKCFPER